MLMIVTNKTNDDELQLDTELCRAMFEKDPDKMIELVSEWLEANGLTTSENFQMPLYLDQVLAGATGYSGTGGTVRIYAS
ncbi:hypothetical protein [uncultured Roseibium sp.]|uniref:hypothetical protein n=2 Tax=uncultured Roseibium sp. TaxID=1936171 RepID=UPI0026309F52|nr:hypothetical protein [uncultured Roseibium sp.]